MKEYLLNNLLYKKTLGEVCLNDNNSQFLSIFKDNLKKIEKNNHNKSREQ